MSYDVTGLFPDAIKDEEFHVFYQPKVSLKNYTLVGAEALCRWFHDGKIVPPCDFIPVLEQSGKICELDFYMLEHVCKDLRKWIDEGRRIVKVSVNLSRVHTGDEKLTEKLFGIIDKYSVPHEYIEIELVETTTDSNFTYLRKIVNDLHERGIHTSVDDFGIGYSSMNLIQELPWNVLKIDKSFLPDDANSDRKRFVMLKHLISLAQDLGLDCIVEGVETETQIKILKENGCFLAQGFYFDKPLPFEVFQEKLHFLVR